MALKETFDLYNAKVIEKFNALKGLIDSAAGWVGLSPNAGQSLTTDLEGKVYFKERTPEEIASAYEGLTTVERFTTTQKTNLENLQSELNNKADLDPATGKLVLSQIPKYSITDVIKPTENTLAAFITNVNNYLFDIGDVIIIESVPDVNGDTTFTHYLYDGEDRSLEASYNEINPATVATIDWASITSKPVPVTNLSGTNTGDQDLSGLETTVNVDSKDAITLQAAKDYADSLRNIVDATYADIPALIADQNAQQEDFIYEVLNTGDGTKGYYFYNGTIAGTIEDYTSLTSAEVQELTAQADAVYISTTDDPQTIFDATPEGKLIRFLPGTHLHGINNNGKTENSILYANKSMFIELMPGAVLKLADNTIALGAEGEITTNQGTAKTLDDMSIGATSNYTGGVRQDYFIEIDGIGTPDTFKWGLYSPDEVVTNIQTLVPITGNEQTLENGIKIKFGATTGHNVGSIWFVSYDGAEHYGIRIGNGQQMPRIQNVHIFGTGTIDLNIENNVQCSLLVANIPACVLIHGAVSYSGVKDITMQNAHRTFMLYGEHSGEYLAGGGTTGGFSFDAYHNYCLRTKNLNYTVDGYGILLGHPMHRGKMKFTRCNENYIHSLKTGLEPNFNLIEYEMVGNILEGTTNSYAIHLWRKSQFGVIKQNILLNDKVGTKTMTLDGAPGGWALPANNEKSENYNVRFGNPVTREGIEGSDDPQNGLISYFPLMTSSQDSINAGVTGVDLGMTYDANGAKFDLADSKISVADNDLFSFTDGTKDLPFTMTMKVTFADLTSGVFINKVDNASTQAEYFIWFNGASILIQICDLTTTAYIGRKFDVVPVLGQEYNISFTYDGLKLTTGISMYFDDEFVGVPNAGTAYSGMKNSTSKVVLGKTGWTDAHQFKGNIRDLRFFNEVKNKDGIYLINRL